MRPKHSRWCGTAHAGAKILAPIPTARWAAADIGELRDQTQAAIAAALRALRAPYDGRSVDDRPAELLARSVATMSRTPRRYSTARCTRRSALRAD